MTAQFPDPQLLQDEFARAAERYASLRKLAEASVVKRVWSRGTVYAMRPFAIEIGGWGRGKILPGPPSKPEGNEYGFDAHGRLAMMRLYGGRNEEFVAYSDGAAEHWAFELYPPSAPKPLFVGRYGYEGSRLITFACFFRTSTVAAVYEYAGDRLVTMHERTSNPAATRTYRFHYDASGSLARLESSEEKAKKKAPARVKYAAPTQPLPKVVATLKEMLVAQIPLAVKRMKLRAPAFCLALSYDDESYDGLLPPNLALGLERERVRWHKQKGKKDIETLWSVDEFETSGADELDLEDPALLAAARELTAHMRELGTSAPARKLLIDVAKVLNQLDWTTIVRVTKDFIVYPIDDEISELRKNMKAVLPAKTLAALKARGEL